jgi:hypothetical protein
MSKKDKKEKSGVEKWLDAEHRRIEAKSIMDGDSLSKNAKKLIDIIDGKKKKKKKDKPTNFVSYKMWAFGYFIKKITNDISLLIKDVYYGLKWLLLYRPNKVGFPYSVKNYSYFDKVVKLVELFAENDETKNHLGVRYVGEMPLTLPKVCGEYTPTDTHKLWLDVIKQEFMEAYPSDWEERFEQWKSKYEKKDEKKDEKKTTKVDKKKAKKSTKKTAKKTKTKKKK